MRPSLKIVPLLLAACLAPACEDGAPWSTETSASPETPHDFGPTAVYSRRLVFMGPGDQLPTAAIFDFTSLSDSLGVRRGLRARVLLDQEWTTVLDAGWTLEPMREPWRIVPGGDLKVVVNGAGEVSALAVPGEPGVRLQPGSRLAEGSPDAGTQFVLRQATLTVGDETIRGILLDSQLGRAVDPALVPPAPGPDAGGDADLDSDADEAENDDPAEADDEAPGPDLGPISSGQPTPLARAGAEAFLVNNSGYYVVFANSAGGEVAWISHAGTDDLRRGGILEPTAWSEPADDAATVPTQWRVGGPGGLTGELSALVTDAVPLTGLGQISSLGYILVSGWVADDGVRRDVFGLVRHIR